MIQDIFPHEFDNHFKADRVPVPLDTLFCFSGDSVLCALSGGIVSFPDMSLAAAGSRSVYLFELDGQAFFLLQDELPAPEGFEYVHIRALRKKDTQQKALIFAAITARHLNDWYEKTRFCGSCGGALVHSKKERAMECPRCKKTYYPRINPAVIVGVTNGDSLLLTKYAGRNLPFYALVAGFTEIGESFEETVRREVKEEVGLEVSNIRYYKSQPWGFSGDILAGYFCDVCGSFEIRMDTGELKEAVWMQRAQVPGQPDDFSLTNEMMLAFRDGKV